MIRKFYVSGFRNLKEQALIFDKSFIFVFGANGSGKTSFIESVYTLFNGKSFRSSKIKNIVNLAPEVNEFVLRAELVATHDSSDMSLALRKSRTESYLAKVNDDTVTSISQLASVSPTQVIEPRSFNLLEGGSSPRRRFVDWGVFHVEHSFRSAWKSYSNCLRQRNVMLRGGRTDPVLLDSWDKQLAKYGMALDRSRRDLVESFIALLRQSSSEFIPDEIMSKLEFRYYAGWDSSKQLIDVLIDNRDRDVQRKKTHNGAHLSDLRVLYEGLPVSEGLSRGQQKLVVLAMHMALVRLVKERTHKHVLLLVDDLGAELDAKNVALLLWKLLSLDATVIATGLDRELVNDDILKADKSLVPQMFHVEHGKIQEVKA